MFSFALYKEGLRRCFIPAIIFNAVMLLFAMIVPISMLSQASRVGNWQSGFGGHGGWSESIYISGVTANPFLLVALLLAFFLTLHTFSFLRERKASDFYHSIPHKRESLFLSYSAAVFSWVVASIVTSTLVSSAIYAVGPEGIIFNFGSVVVAALAVMAACFVIISATLVAMSVTGTVVSNIATTGLVLGLPQILIGVFIANTLSMTRGLIFANGVLPFGHTGWVMALTRDGGSLWTVLYVVVLALLHFALAYFLFKKRKSETAGVSASSSLVQSVIRCAIAIAITIPVLLLIITEVNNTGSEFVVISIYAIAVIAYFAYEAITGRRLRKTRTRTFAGLMVGLAVVLLFNIIFVAGVNVNREVVFSRYRDAERIDAVQVNIGWWQASSYAVVYGSVSLEDFIITDDDAIELLVGAHNRNIENIRTRGERSRHDNWHFEYGIQNMSVVFDINSPRASTRNLMITWEERQALVGTLSSNEELIEAFILLPENPSHIDAWVDIGDWETRALSAFQARRVYDLLLEEIDEIDPVAWFVAVNFQDNWGNFRFSISGEVNGRHYWDNLPINSTLTPRTYALMRELARAVL